MQQKHSADPITIRLSTAACGTSTQRKIRLMHQSLSEKGKATLRAFLTAPDIDAVHFFLEYIAYVPGQYHENYPSVLEEKIQELVSEYGDVYEQSDILVFAESELSPEYPCPDWIGIFNELSVDQILAKVREERGNYVTRTFRPTKSGIGFNDPTLGDHHKEIAVLLN